VPDFFSLSASDQREALQQVQAETGRRLILLEKDVWVVWALQQLFSARFAGALVFKGGTSLSKAYSVIQRFSEDVDITFDIRSMAPDLVAASGGVYPKSQSEQKRWKADIRRRLSDWIASDLQPFFAQALRENGLTASLRLEGSEQDKLVVEYPSLGEDESAYLRRGVRLEFGARSTGEPCTTHHIVCDAASFIPEITFPQADPRVMTAERTFWEKATAVHVFCLQGSARGAGHFSRHHHDLSRLHRHGIAASAVMDRELAAEVARHKAWFFRENDRDRVVIDYLRAVNGELQLVPSDPATRAALRDDYEQMLAEGLLPEGTEGFDELMEECQLVETTSNETLRADKR
jgi:hypothetical protein